jgi:hypothetical protein
MTRRLLPAALFAAAITAITLLALAFLLSAIRSLAAPWFLSAHPAGGVAAPRQLSEHNTQGVGSPAARLRQLAVAAVQTASDCSTGDRRRAAVGVCGDVTVLRTAVLCSPPTASRCQVLLTGVLTPAARPAAALLTQQRAVGGSRAVPLAWTVLLRRTDGGWLVSGVSS